MSPLSYYHPRRIPSSSKYRDTIVEEGNPCCSSSIGDLATKPSQQRLSQHTYLTRGSSVMSGGSSCVVGGPMQHHGYPQHRPAALTDFTVTESTKFSSASSINNSPVGEESNVSSKSKKSSCRKLRIGGLKLPKLINRQRKPLSESQLRKRVKKAAEKGDWASVRKLISNYEFSDIPEVLTKKQQQRASLKQQKRDSVVPEIPLREEPASASRRPSYGSRNGERRSFTGKESTAAAAAIMASLLEESLESLESVSVPDFGENILHDVCRCCPPLDVTETLLKALRHRRGVTSGTDDLGRTPLHLAAHSGVVPQVIEAIVRADPSPATMGDVDRRSPLHLAMRHLAYGENTNMNSSSSSLEALDRTCQTVLILKDVMLTYPGRIGFKDEDAAGFTPLDYGLDGNISKEELLHSLIRRKEPRVGRGTRRVSLSRRTNMIRRMGSTSSIDDDQDIEILRQLEQDEIEARKLRIQKLKSRQQKEIISDALFDVFGIEEQPAATPAEFACPTKHLEVQAPAEVEATADEVEPGPDIGMTDEDIYDRHLQDYLDEYMDDFEGCEDLEYCDEDGFDILEDPSLVRQQDEHAKASVDDSALQGGVIVPPVIIVSDNYDDDDDCNSMVSEITAPLITR